MKNESNTYAIFSDGARHGTSSSSSSSLSHCSSSSLPDILNDDDVNISGTGKIDGLRLPVNSVYSRVSNQIIRLPIFGAENVGGGFVPRR